MVMFSEHESATAVERVEEQAQVGEEAIVARDLLLALVVLQVFYVTMVSISQLALTLLMSTLQSRRLRDLSILLLALVSSSFYLFGRLIFVASNGRGIAQMLNKAAFSPYLQWLPSGVAAGALRTAQQGNWGGSFALLGLLVLITLVALYLWQRVLESSLSASESGTYRRARQRALAIPVAPVTSIFAPAVVGHAPLTPIQVAPGAILRYEEARPSTRPGAPVRAVSGRAGLREQIRTLVRKELTCYWRDPLLKALIFRRAIYLVLVVLRRLLWGKNIAVALLGLIALFAMLILSAALSGQPALLPPAVLIGLAGFGVALGCANLVSVCFPRYQPELGRRSMAGAGNQGPGGRLSEFPHGPVWLPVVLGIGLPYVLDQPLIWLASVPLSLAYGITFYIILTNLSARRLLKREPEILALTTRE